ncbi:MAG TPA: tetratricopeptide repeat protein, partial [Bryobacteraceae bacterium]|nr:tetratricopeptide repeat protein [Bryobacteraceae bacterium]
MVSLAILVTVLAFQNVPPKTANGLRVASNDKTTPDAAKALTPEVRGDIYMARKMFRDAIDAYQSGPKDSPILANKTGIAYHQLLDFGGAKKYYERAIKLNPKYAEAINNLGTIYYTDKSYRRAINQYKKAIALEPQAASFWSNLGVAYFQRKNYTEADKANQQALELDPDVFLHHGTGGVVIQQLSVEDRARWHYWMAKAYAKSGQNELAIQTIRQALEEGF